MAYASTITVTATGGTVADDGLCSISEAVLNADKQYSIGGTLFGLGADMVILQK